MPDERVDTLLSVPLTGARGRGSTQPGTGSQRGRHARTRAPRTSVKAHRGRRPQSGPHAEMAATLRIGLLSAGVVLVLTTLGLVLLSRLP